MFDNDDSIPDSDESFQIIDEEGIITRVEADRWLIENIDNPLEPRTDLSRETDTLRLTSRESIRTPIQCDIIESHS
jgi:hypothetical protein